MTGDQVRVMINEGRYCMYLRKSRADVEAESKGETETLARHERLLLEAASKMNLTITQIYKEIVTADTIAARPAVQRLLREVEQGMWTGVFVVDVDRLARGDTQDQGIVQRAFKVSGTKIITPMKVYDPDNEFDEEYFEFGLFMSRREYKIINRRLQRGRIASVKEGKYIASTAPFGYEKVKIKNDKGYTLKIVPEEAEIVRLIFSWYVGGITDENGSKKRLGIQQIARRLNEMRIPPIRHEYWQKETVRDILINPVYIGKVRWKWRPCHKKIVDGRQVVSRPRNYDEDCIIADGLHEPIIDKKTFDLAQAYLNSMPPCPVGRKEEIKNPFAGLIVCGKCGRKMVYRKGANKKPAYIRCRTRGCGNVSAPYHLVGARILNALHQWLAGYQVRYDENGSDRHENIDLLKKSLGRIENEIAALEKQRTAAHDLLEQGIYTTELFFERAKAISERLENTRKDYKTLSNELSAAAAQEENRRSMMPKTAYLIEAYEKVPTPAQKNEILKAILEKAVYIKNVSGMRRGHHADEFELILYPKLPKFEA